MRRLPTSKEEVSSLTSSSIRFPATVSPCSAHIEPGTGNHLLAGGGKRAGQRHDHADLDGVLGGRAAAAVAATARVMTIRASLLLHMDVLR